MRVLERQQLCLVVLQVDPFDTVGDGGVEDVRGKETVCCGVGRFEQVAESRVVVEYHIITILLWQSIITILLWQSIIASVS